MGNAPAPWAVERCPRCRGGLVPFSVTELSELRCAVCQGAWLDSPAVEALGEELGMRARTFIARMRTALPPLWGALKCIRCHAPMSRLHLRTVEVDACARCGGMWLDPGELGRLSGGRHGEPAEGEIRRRAAGEVPAEALERRPGGVRELLRRATDRVEDAAGKLAAGVDRGNTVLLARMEEGPRWLWRMARWAGAELSEMWRAARKGPPRP
ncbi:MAG: zf-TFIIB domain-containing protein [Myxococcota bacterium]